MFKIVVQRLAPLWDQAVATAGDAVCPSTQRREGRPVSPLSFSCHSHHHPTAGGHHH
jgi:hypothetical protein